MKETQTEESIVVMTTIKYIRKLLVVAFLRFLLRRFPCSVDTQQGADERNETLNF
jgi:hypothetical protein